MPVARTGEIHLRSDEPAAIPPSQRNGVGHARLNGVGSMRVDILESVFERVLPEWDRLFEADPSATPFACTSWATAWIEHWDPSARPWIVTIRDGEDLVGLAPLVLRRKGPLRAVHVLGKEPGDYWTPLSRPEAREETSRLLAMELARRSGDWDLLYVDALPHASPAERALTSS